MQKNISQFLQCNFALEFSGCLLWISWTSCRKLDIVKPKLIHKAGQTLIDISNKVQICCRVEKYLKDFWFGYHYNTSAGEWTWFDEPNSTYKAWHRGYPELQNSCARMSENGVWKDRNCDDLLPYICKKPTSMLHLEYDAVHSSRKQHCLARYIQLRLHV